MYLCNHCGELFDEPRGIRDNHDMPGPHFEIFNVCPGCGDDDYEPGDICYICGNPISENDYPFEMCGSCEAATLTLFKHYMNSFSPQQQKYLDNYFDGRHLDDSDV